MLLTTQSLPVLRGGPIYPKQVPKADRKSGKVGLVLARNDWNSFSIDSHTKTVSM